MSSFAWDLKEAFRGLRKAPALVAICVLSLGLGVGVNLTLFSWLSAMFFDQPTIARPHEVVGIEPGNSNQLSYLNYRDLKDAAIFESVFGYRRTELSLRTVRRRRAFRAWRCREISSTALVSARSSAERSPTPRRRPNAMRRVVVASHAILA